MRGTKTFLKISQRLSKFLKHICKKSIDRLKPIRIINGVTFVLHINGADLQIVNKIFDENIGAVEKAVQVGYRLKHGCKVKDVQIEQIGIDHNVAKEEWSRMHSSVTHTHIKSRSPSVTQTQTGLPLPMSPIMMTSATTTETIDPFIDIDDADAGVGSKRD